MMKIIKVMHKDVSMQMQIEKARKIGIQTQRDALTFLKKLSQCRTKH